MFTLLSKIEVDRAVLYGILLRLWNIIAVPVSILFIAYKFSPQIQGFYYTFLSIITFQFLIELGLSNLIIQFASHEWSRLSLNNNGKIIGQRESLSRLQSLAQIFFRWYFVASIILTLGLGIGGYFFFLRNRSANINWMLPWFCLCISNGWRFCLVPVWALLEGCNQVAKLYAYRFIEGLVSSLSLWIAILLGAQLWAVSISNAVILICAGLFLMYKYRSFFKTLLFSSPTESRIKWRQEIFSVQWRIALSTLIGAFSFNLFVPVLFKYHGPIIAGQMGMTWSIASVVLSIAYAWLNPKVPQFGMLIAKKKYKELDKLFWRITKISISVAMVGGVTAFSIICILNKTKYPLAVRFLPPLATGIFLLSQIVLVIGVPFAIYLRAHKKEPLLFLSVISGISIGLFTLILGKYYSAVGMAIGYFSVNFILVPIVIIIWHRCRIEWHKEGYDSDVIIDNAIVASRALS